MALIKCPECGNNVSDTAKTCPHCGYELKKENNREDIQTVRVKSKNSKIKLGAVLTLVGLFFASIIGFNAIGAYDPFTDGNLGSYSETSYNIMVYTVVIFSIIGMISAIMLLLNKNVKLMSKIATIASIVVLLAYILDCVLSQNTALLLFVSFTPMVASIGGALSIIGVKESEK